MWVELKMKKNKNKKTDTKNQDTLSEKKEINQSSDEVSSEQDYLRKELELGMFHWAKIDGITIKRTLYLLLNPKRYHSNATQIFKEEILGMLTTPLSKTEPSSEQ